MTIRVLICEPDDLLLSGYISFFDRFQGLQPESSSDAMQCLERMRELHPDIILLEPEYFIEASCMLLDVTAVPVFVLSRFSNRESIRSHPAVAEYYVKPIPLPELVSRIRKIVELHRTATNQS